MRAAIYARYSTELQRAESIEDQVRVCESLILSEGWTPWRVYSDEATSGATYHRPGFQKLLEDAQTGLFDVLVAESLDRLSRDQEHVAGLYKRLTFLGIPIHTRAEGRVTEIHVGLKGTMNALFLKDLALKTHRGLEGRVKAGKSAGGISYGYRVVRSVGPDGNYTTGEREVDPAQAAVVARIFRDFVAGKSPRAIAAQLNEEGIPCPTGGAWGQSTIHGNPKRGTGILNNELYIGLMVWNRQRFVKDPDTGRRVSRPNPPEAWETTKVPHLRIIPDDLWEAAKRQQQGRRHQASDGEDPNAHPERARRRKYLFSGMLFCGCCGGSYTLVGKTRYGCASARNKGEAVCTNRKTIERTVLEDRILTGIRDSLLHPDLIAEFIAEYQREWSRLNKEKIESLTRNRRELTRVIRQIDQIITAITDGMYHPSMKAKMDGLEARKAALEAEIAATEAPATPSLHPGLAGAYRRKVEELAAALSHDDNRPAAMDQLRGLLTEVRLIPEDDGLGIELVGKLASILELSRVDTTKPRSIGSGAGSITMVAGVGFEPTTFRL